MHLLDELINYSALILPVLLAIAALVLAGNSPQRRLISVIVPAACGILAVGFGLQGLTRSCFSNEAACEQGFTVVEKLGNSFGDQQNCHVCADAPTKSSPAFILNAYRPLAVIVAAITCCQLSLLSLVMFVRWMRRIERESKKLGPRDVSP